MSLFHHEAGEGDDMQTSGPCRAQSVHYGAAQGSDDAKRRWKGCGGWCRLKQP